MFIGKWLKRNEGTQVECFVVVSFQHVTLRKSGFTPNQYNCTCSVFDWNAMLIAQTKNDGERESEEKALLFCSNSFTSTVIYDWSELIAFCNWLDSVVGLTASKESLSNKQIWWIGNMTTNAIIRTLYLVSMANKERDEERIEYAMMKRYHIHHGCDEHWILS